MPGLLVSHEAGDADAQSRVTALGLMRATTDHQIVANPHREIRRICKGRVRQ
jgi:hypothetical protein